MLNTAGVNPGDLGDDFIGAANSVRYYQIDCGCAGIWLYKNLATGKVAIELF